MTSKAQLALHLRNVVLTGITCAFFLLLHGLVVQTEFGRTILRASQDLSLRSLEQLRPSPIHTTIVDISDLPYTAVGSLDPHKLVPDRVRLMKYLTRLQEAGPYGIAIDVDFSSGSANLMSTYDPKIVELAKKIGLEGTPVFLGASDGRNRGPSAITDTASSITGCIWAPDDTQGLMLSEYFPPDQPTPIPSLGERLLSRSPIRPSKPSGLLKFLLDCGVIEARETIDGADGSRYELIPIDYSIDDAIPVIRYSETGGLEVAINQIKNRFLILGDYRRPDLDDVFPTYAGRFAPGVMHHAMQLETLLDKRLYRVGHTSDILIDIALACVVVVLTSISIVRKHGNLPDDHAAQAQRVYVFASLIVILLTLCVIITRIVWLSSWVVVAALLTHTKAHSWLEDFLSRQKAQDKSEPS